MDKKLMLLNVHKRYKAAQPLSTDTKHVLSTTALTHVSSIPCCLNLVTVEA